MTFTVNELLTCILNCDAGLGYDYAPINVKPQGGGGGRAGRPRGF